jgi:Domain of unknown function (DUF4282)
VLGVAAFQAGTGAGIMTLFVLAPIGALVYAIYTRVILELIIAVFRIAEHTRDGVAELRAARAGAQEPAGESVPG